jgi:hypothetical protein
MLLLSLSRLLTVGLGLDPLEEEPERNPQRNSAPITLETVMRDPVDTLLFNGSPTPTSSVLLELLDEMAWFIESSFDLSPTVSIVEVPRWDLP